MRLLYAIFLCMSLAYAQDRPTIHLFCPPEDRWSEIRDLRLQMLTEGPEVFGVLSSDLKHMPEEYWRTWIRESHEQKHRWLICAECDGQLVGMVGAIREWDAYTPLAHIVSITNVYVKPEYRRQGIASQLMRTLCSLLEADPRLDEAMLWVTCSQSAAIALYKRLGFRIEGTLPRAIKINGTYYDNYLMCKTIRNTSEI